MDNLVLVDTSAWICFFARKGFIEIKEAVSTLLDNNSVAIAGPIIVELIQGARTENEKEIIKSKIKGLHWLGITDEHWHKTAELSFSLRRKGVTISAFDSLLSTIAIEYNCSILHKDSDFETIARHMPLRLFNLSETNR
ncbi:MAG: PIN domain-containing protein [Nitrospirae bacterium]|nr:PIN domain-containing protein [Nitrospirota bacterium]